MNKKLLLPLLALLASAAPASVHAQDWVVAKVSQPSTYTEDRKTWVTIKPGMTVKDQSWISTGPRGRVVLQRAKDRVTFQPNTLAGVFERPGFSVHTDFAQQSGEIRLEIDPRKKPHLAVQTPYLAAVVKGTVFTVSVTKKGAKVGVERGRVEVTDALSGEQTGIRAGQQAAVDTNPSTPMSLTGKNTNFEPVVVTKPLTSNLPTLQPASTAAPSPSKTTSGDDTAAESGDKSGTGGNGGKSGSSGAGKGSGDTSGKGTGSGTGGKDVSDKGSGGTGSSSGSGSGGGSGGKGSGGKGSGGKGSDGKGKDSEGTGNGNGGSSGGGRDGNGQSDADESGAKGPVIRDDSAGNSGNDASGDSDNGAGKVRGSGQEKGGDRSGKDR